MKLDTFYEGLADDALTRGAEPLTQSLISSRTKDGFERQTIHSMMSRKAEEIGDQPALYEVMADASLGRSWTYSELHGEAEKLGRALANRHDRGERIAVFANNLPEWILLELASAYAGTVLVTVNPALLAREVRYVLEQSKASAIYFADFVRGRALGPVVEEATAGLEHITYCIRLADEASMYDGHDRGELRETAPEDVVQIQYTSGTTGFPKGALLHQMGLIQNGIDSVGRMGAQTGDRLPLYMPLFHTAGCAILTLGGLSRGVTLYLMADFDPAVAVELISKHKLRFMMGVPTMLVAIMDVAEKTGTDVTSIDGVLSGGSMVAPELVKRSEKVFGVPMLIIYGQTEASPGITGTFADDEIDDLSGTIGLPYPHQDVAIMKPGTSDVLPLGEQGEICSRGYNVMAAYNDNPDATAATIDEEGWLHTGDLGTMDARGYLKITGRVKEMIIRGGENLFPAEIENALLEHPAISEIAIVGISDEKWGELVACFMRATDGPKPEAAELKAFIRERLSPQKTPAYWIWVDEWPLTGSGKIQRFALRDQFVEGKFEALTA